MAKNRKNDEDPMTGGLGNYASNNPGITFPPATEVGEMKQYTSDGEEVVTTVESSVTTDVTIFITTEGDLTLGAVRNFVERLERLHTPDEAVLDGHIGVTISIDNTFVDQIECGECGTNDFLVFSNEHNCG